MPPKLKLHQFPFSIGTDICHIPRIHRLLTGPYDVPFLRRILRPEERLASKARCEDLVCKWKEAAMRMEKIDKDVKESQKSIWRAAKKGGGGEKEAWDRGKERGRLLAKEWERAKGELEGAVGGLNKAVAFLAGRWAAKEAVIKASSTKVYMGDVSITTDEKPMAWVLPSRFKGKAEITEEEWEEARPAQISISHDGDYATAVCIRYIEPEGVEDIGEKGMGSS